MKGRGSFRMLKLALILCIILSAVWLIAGAAPVSASEPGGRTSISPGGKSGKAETQEEALVLSHLGGRGPAETAQQKIEDWNEINSDTYAWIRVPGTNIDYPVVQGDDNFEYLYINYYRKYNIYSVIWADYRVRFGDRAQLSSNTVLYGHNYDNLSGTPLVANSGHKMFEQLPSFHYLDFARENQFIHYSTEEGDHIYQIFAVFYTDVYFNYIRVNTGRDALCDIISEARRLSLHDYDMEVDGTRKIITLSTCTRARGGGGEQRFVVMGQLVDKGVVPEKVSVTAAASSSKL